MYCSPMNCEHLISNIPLQRYIAALAKRIYNDMRGTRSTTPFIVGEN